MSERRRRRCGCRCDGRELVVLRRAVRGGVHLGVSQRDSPLHASPRRVSRRSRTREFSSCMSADRRQVKNSSIANHLTELLDFFGQSLYSPHYQAPQPTPGCGARGPPNRTVAARRSLVPGPQSHELQLSPRGRGTPKAEDGNAPGAAARGVSVSRATPGACHRRIERWARIARPGAFETRVLGACAALARRHSLRARLCRHGPGSRPLAARDAGALGLRLRRRSPVQRRRPDRGGRRRPRDRAHDAAAQRASPPLRALARARLPPHAARASRWRRSSSPTRRSALQPAAKERSFSFLMGIELSLFMMWNLATFGASCSARRFPIRRSSASTSSSRSRSSHSSCRSSARGSSCVVAVGAGALAYGLAAEPARRAADPVTGIAGSLLGAFLTRGTPADSTIDADAAVREVA